MSLKKFFIIMFPALLFLSLSCVEKKSHQNDANFRLITYNVWYGFTKVPERKPLWLEWMKAHKPDVVCLQELNEYTPEQLTQDAKAWGHDYTVLLKEDGFPTGITSKYPIEDVRRTLDGFHHGLIRARINGIYFYTVHLHPSNWEVRHKEIDWIIADMKTLPQDAKIIVAGDFNSMSEHDTPFYAHGLLEPFFVMLDTLYNGKNLKDGKLDYDVLTKLENAGFTDLEFALRPDDYAFTGSFPTLIPKEGKHGRSRRLDYVFANKPLAKAARSVRVIADYETQFLSDHLPMIADFKLE